MSLQNDLGALERVFEINASTGPRSGCGFTSPSKVANSHTRPVTRREHLAENRRDYNGTISTFCKRCSFSMRCRKRCI